MLVSYITLARSLRPARPGQKPHSCKQAVRERIIIAKALKVTAAAACSGAAPLLEFRHDCQGAAPSSNHAFIAYARPMTIS